MSEMKDLFIYNLFDYMKTIYIYSHLKTNLVDRDRQKIEIAIVYLFIISSICFIIFSLFKIFIIIFYFIVIQALTGFIKFIKSIFKTKFRINFCSHFKNAMYYLGKVFRRIYTFNFYIFENKCTGFLMISSYFLFLFSSCFFHIKNKVLIETIEKDITYMVLFYIHFESFILVQLLFSSFYACHNLNVTSLLSIGLFLTMNGILFMGYFITELYENTNGSFEFEEPQLIINIIFNTILFLLNGTSLCKVIFHKKDGK